MVTDMHLNDNQIQDYLDGNLTGTDPAVLHLEKCADCRRAVENYRVLYSSLKADPGFALPPDFADKVITRLPEPQATGVREKPEWFKVREWVVMVASLAVVTGTALFFVNPISLLKSLFGWADQPALSGGSLVRDISTHVSGLGFNPTLLLFVALTVVIIAVIDHFLARRRPRHEGISTFA
jgi:hypothetical protein